MEELKKIGTEIKKRRKLLGIIQPDLAEIAGISLRSLKEIETGKGNPTFIQLLKVLDSLGLRIKIESRSEND
ncbi:MAG TPA: helix-turn-helix domain-containing protein [Ignavibacteria bacterium]